MSVTSPETLWATPASFNKYMVPMSRAGGSYGSGVEHSRSELIGRAAPNSNVADIPTILAHSVDAVKNLGNTFFPKAVLNGVPAKNRASYIPPIGVSSTGSKLLMAGDNYDNPAQSSILNSYVGDFAPYGLLDFRAIKQARRHIEQSRRAVSSSSSIPRIKQYRDSVIKPYRNDSVFKPYRGSRADFYAPIRPYQGRLSRYAADSRLSEARVPIVNTLNPLGLPGESKIMYADPISGRIANSPAYTRPTRELESMLTRGGLLGLFGGLIGGFDPPTTTNTSISYTTSVSDQQAFKTSVSSFNQTINQYILNQTVSTQTEIANLANINIVDLSGQNVDLNISNAQNITFLNMAKLNVTDVNQFVLSQSTAVFDSILSAFQASSTASLTTLATAQSNTNLIDSILGAPKQSDNINNTIALNTSVQTAFNSERDSVYQNLANNSTVRNFAQNFMIKLQQTFNLNVSNVSASQNLSVFVNNTQAINSTLDIVTKLDLSTATFNTINTSDTFKIDKSVTTSTQATATATTAVTNSSESVGSAIQSIGKAASGLISSATMAVVGPILAGAAVLAIGSGAAIYFLRQNKKRDGTARGDDDYDGDDGNQDWFNET